MEPFEELNERKEIDKLKQELNTNRIAYQTAMDTLVEMTEELTKTKQALDVAVDALIYANKCIKGGCVNWITQIDKALDQIKQIVGE